VLNVDIYFNLIGDNKKGMPYEHPCKDFDKDNLREIFFALEPFGTGIVISSEVTLLSLLSKSFTRDKQTKCVVNFSDLK
jgi:hypothetical protein